MAFSGVFGVVAGAFVASGAFEGFRVFCFRVCKMAELWERV